MYLTELEQRELAWYELALECYKRREGFNGVCGTIAENDQTKRFRNLWISNNVPSADLLPVLHTQRTTDLINDYWFKGSKERVVALKASIKILKEKLDESNYPI